MALRLNMPQYTPRGHRRINGPIAEPVSPAELITFVRAEGVLTESEARSYISQAREFLEEWAGIAFISQTWRLTLDAWPGYVEPWWDGVREIPITELYGGRPRDLMLPRYPLISVSSVKVYDEASNETAVNIAATFDVDVESKPGRLGLKFGQIWPLATRPTNAVQIEYVAGYGASLNNVPAGLRGAVLNLAGYYYQHRGECDMRQAAAKSGAIDVLAMYTSGGL